MSQRIRVRVWSDISWAVLVTGIAVAMSLWALLAGRGRTLESLSPSVSLLAYALVMGAAASVYCHWRLAGFDSTAGLDRPLSGWLVAGLILAALPHLTIEASRQASADGTLDAEATSLLVTQLVIVAVLVLITWVSEHTELPSDPALVGAVVGMVLTAGTWVMAVAWPELRLGSTGRAVAGTMLVLGGVFLAWSLLQRTQVSPWVRRRLAISAVALVCAQGLGHVDGAVAAGATIAGNLLGALVLCATAWRLLRETLQGFQEEVTVMHSALHEKDVVVHEQKELLHELGSTLAGIAAASEIIRDEPRLPEPKRRRLEEMREAEVSRLIRIMGDRNHAPVMEAVDVDEVLSTIVLSHRARGRDVSWRPSGLTAVGCADNLAEVVNILLENAARHADGAPVFLSTKAVDLTVQIVCSDLGPGVPADMRGRLFDTGVRRPESPGQGLGLSIARRLIGQTGGSLVLRHETNGATFVVRLPQRVEARRMTDVVARAS